MIETLKLKFGSSESQPPLQLSPTPITIFVGPNNSGKSKVLMEIEHFCSQGLPVATNVILEELTYKPLSEPQAEIDNYTLPLLPTESLPAGQIMFGKRGFRTQVNKSSMLSFLSDVRRNRPQFSQYYLRFNTIRIDGQSRINLVTPQKANDLQTPPVTTLDVLFKDKLKRLEVRRIIFEAFKKYFVIDPTHPGHFRIRLSNVPPTNDKEEQALDAEAIAFHSKALDIDMASDGVRAFTGIVTTIVAGDPKVILIDEPEAFLHPSLAATLGKEICNSLRGTSKNLFSSTHSSNFVMGCIQSGVPLNIVRLTYLAGVPTARILSYEQIAKIMRNPLLRSVGVLNGLFYEFVIVTEADADRAFYQEINERLLVLGNGNGIPNCLFLNAQNKQTIRQIIGPLRELGIPCAGIVDVDVIKEGGANWTNMMKSAFMPDLIIASTNTLRNHIKTKFDEQNINYKIYGGIDVLAPGDRESCNALFDQLDDYGIFTVRNGELESWLKYLQVAGHGPEWLISMFEKLGEDPTTPGYVQPTDGDVWEFLERIKQWFLDPNRKGIPS